MNKYKKNNQQNDVLENEMLSEQDAEYINAKGLRTSGGVVRRVNPLGYRVLVKIKKADDLSGGGLYLPEGSKESMQDSILAEVLEVAIATDDDTDEETNVSGIPLGALVLIEKDVGVRIPWDHDLRLVDTNDVLAIINEVNLT